MRTKALLTTCLGLLILFGCSTPSPELKPQVFNLKEGSAKIIREIVMLNYNLREAEKHKRIVYKTEIDVTSLLNEIKAGKINLQDRASALAFYAKLTKTPEVYMAYMDQMIEKSRALAALNKGEYALRQTEYKADVVAELTQQTQLVQVEKAVIEPPLAEHAVQGGIVQSFLGPNGDTYDYQAPVCSGCDASVDGHDPNNPGYVGPGEPDWAAVSNCSQTFNIDTEDCRIAFGAEMAALMLTTGWEVVTWPAFLAGVATITAVNVNCNYQALRHMDYCFTSIGFYKRG